MTLEIESDMFNARDGGKPGYPLRNPEQGPTAESCGPRRRIEAREEIPMFTFEGASEATGPVRLEILDPRGELHTSPLSLIATRLSALEGKKIGILNNTKPGADALQPYLEQALMEAVSNIQIRTWVISYNAYPNKEEDLNALAEWSDGVIAMLGD